MPAVIGAAAAGAIISAGGNAWSAKQANSANKKIAREQMRFQEKMSNTAYQRATKDLEKAGLNRILALGNPASTPSGASYTAQSAELGSALVEGAERGISSAREAKRVNPEIAQIQANTRATDAQAQKTAMDTVAQRQNIEVVVPKTIEEINSRIVQNQMNSSKSEAEKVLTERTMPGRAAHADTTKMVEDLKQKYGDKAIHIAEKYGAAAAQSGKQIWNSLMEPWPSKEQTERFKKFWMPSKKYRFGGK